MAEMTDKQAEIEIDRFYALHPEVVEAMIEVTLIASPLAGSIRILREIQAVLA